MLADRDIARIKDPKQLVILQYHFGQKKDTQSKNTHRLLKRQLKKLDVTAHEQKDLLKEYLLTKSD